MLVCCNWLGKFCDRLGGVNELDSGLCEEWIEA